MLTQVLHVDAKRVHLFHTLTRRHDAAVVATGEQMHLHVDSKAAKATSVDPVVGGRLQALAKAHAALPVPVQKGRSIGLKKG